MGDLVQKAKEKYPAYVASKLGAYKENCGLLYFAGSCFAAQTLMPNYDIGIELATDGLALGYVFHLHGMPTKAAKLGRNGRGATWEPLDGLSQEDIKDKRVLLLDVDIVTGRTMRRAVRELQKFSPQHLDLLLYHGTTIMQVDYYKKWRKHNNLPPPEEFYRHLEGVQVTEIPSGLLVKYLKYGVYPQEFTVSNKETIGCNYEKKVPPGIRKSMSVSKDFKGFAFESYDKFGEIFVERLEEKLTERQNGQ